MKKDHFIPCLIFLLCFGSSLLFGKLCAASDPFPLYPCIEPNVRFWIDAYSKYPTTKGILHDSTMLNIVYDVIELWPQEKPGARKINTKRIKEAKNKYERILEKLAQNPASPYPEARRVAALFGPNAGKPTFRKAMRNIRCQIGQKDRFREGIILSGAYIEEIREIFRSHGLPEDLAFLPHVESSFNPKAYSKFGAAGIWQFTHSTGKRFLTVDYTQDERRDPIWSSRAAAQLLKWNYEKLGSWPMAITAYNHGISGMLRAKSRKVSYEDIFQGYRNRRFRFASRNFYSEFLAAREVAKNYEQYFGMLELERPVETREVLLEGYASISDLSGYFEVDVETIRELNPALRPPVFNEQKYVPKGYALRLPADAVDEIRVASADLLESVYRLRQKPSRFYRVKWGDTIGEIAQTHRVKVSDLILANNLDSSATIYINQNLRIPLPGEKLEQPEALAGMRPRLAGVKEAQSEEVVEKATQDKPSVFEEEMPVSEWSINPAVVSGNLEVDKIVTKDGRQIGMIRVEAEETLGHYAEWLRVPTYKIRRLNGFPYGKLLVLNQSVKIPLSKVTKEEFEQARLEYHQEIQEDFSSVYTIESARMYRVKNGDSIWTLCNDVFSIPLWLMKKYNPDVDLYRLRRAQTLAIPVLEKREGREEDASTPPMAL
jgi:membrane-bound lytic murein transglycosylase D